MSGAADRVVAARARYDAFLRANHAALTDRHHPGHRAVLARQSQLAQAAFPGDPDPAPPVGDEYETITPESLFEYVHGATRWFERGRNYNRSGADPGGKTNNGLSTKLWQAIRAKARSERDYREFRNWPADLMQLTLPQVEHVLRSEFYDRLHMDRLAQVPKLRGKAPKLVPLIYDSVVQHGSNNAGVWLQEALNAALNQHLPVDGVIGPATRATAVEQGMAKNIQAAILARREAHMRSQPEWQTFKRGWTDRLDYFAR